MKVLYIGVYRDNTGYGNMAINTMMALITAGVDVTARPLKLDNSTVELPPQIIEAENKGSGQFDAVIQNLLPNQMEYTGKIPKNIGYFCAETDSFEDTNWPEKLNTMDDVWIPCRHNHFACIDSQVCVRTTKIPIAANMAKYQRSYKPLSIRDQFTDSFIFYYIGEFNRRKNIKALLQAFHLEFGPEEPVELVLKTSVPGLERSKSEEVIRSEIDKIKAGMNLYKSIDYYKKEILFGGRYSNEEIMRIHSTCDCFVCPSHGEAWCLPAFDAMAMGKTPIVSDSGGFLDYVEQPGVGGGYLVKGRQVPVWGMEKNSVNGLYTSQQNWYEVYMNHLRAAMRCVYRNAEERKQKSLAGRKYAYNFSYEKVGGLMKGLLECK